MEFEEDVVDTNDEELLIPVDVVNNESGETEEVEHLPSSEEEDVQELVDSDDKISVLQLKHKKELELRAKEKIAGDQLAQFTQILLEKGRMLQKSDKHSTALSAAIEELESDIQKLKFDLKSTTDEWEDIKHQAVKDDGLYKLLNELLLEGEENAEPSMLLSRYEKMKRIKRELQKWQQTLSEEIEMGAKSLQNLQKQILSETLASNNKIAALQRKRDHLVNQNIKYQNEHKEMSQKQLQQIVQQQQILLSIDNLYSFIMTRIPLLQNASSSYDATRRNGDVENTIAPNISDEKQEQQQSKIRKTKIEKAIMQLKFVASFVEEIDGVNLEQLNPYRKAIAPFKK